MLHSIANLGDWHYSDKPYSSYEYLCGQGHEESEKGSCEICNTLRKVIESNSRGADRIITKALREWVDSMALTYEDGMVRRWCYGTPGEGCSHYITTREPSTKTEWHKTTKLHGPKGYISWSMENDPNWMSQENMIEWVQHIPYCKFCLGHDNSYLFPAWYDISRAQIDRVIELYKANYPVDLQQPIFFSGGDNYLDIRLPTVPDVDDDSDGSIDLDTLETEFVVCYYWPRKKNTKETYKDSIMKTFKFDLSTSEGWQDMLEEFPQKKRVLS